MHHSNKSSWLRRALASHTCFSLLIPSAFLDQSEFASRKWINHMDRSIFIQLPFTTLNCLICGQKITNSTKMDMLTWQFLCTCVMSASIKQVFLSLISFIWNFQDVSTREAWFERLLELKVYRNSETESAKILKWKVLKEKVVNITWDDIQITCLKNIFDLHFYTYICHQGFFSQTKEFIK